MAKSFSERRRAYQAHKFSSKFKKEKPQTTYETEFSREPEKYLGRIVDTIKTTIAEREGVTPDALGKEQFDKYGVQRRLLSSRKNEFLTSFDSDDMRGVYTDMLRKGVMPTQIARAVVDGRLERDKSGVPTIKKPTNQPVDWAQPIPPKSEVDFEKLGIGAKAPNIREMVSSREALSTGLKLDAEARAQSLKDALPTPISRLLFGNKEKRYDQTGFTPDRTGANVVETVGNVLRGEYEEKGLSMMFTMLTRTRAEKIRDYTQTFQNAGAEPKRAIELASSYVDAGEMPTDARPQEVAAVNTRKWADKAWTTLELLDFAGVGKKVMGGMGATYTRRSIEEAMQTAQSATDMRRYFAERFPHLKGTDELDTIVETARTVQNSNKVEKTFADLAQQARDAKTPTVSRGGDTLAQQVVYEKGIPVLRGTRASGAEEVVAVRDQIRTALKGEMENMRLSNREVLESEIKAGTLKFKQTADESVEVFSPSVRPRLQVGERVSLSKEVMEQSLGVKGVTPSKVSPDDLVRLPDGTFVYAPKKYVGQNIEPMISSLRPEQIRQARVLEKSRTDNVAKLAKKAEETAKTKANEARIAKETAEQARRERVAEAERTLRTAEVRRTRAVAELSAKKADQIKAVNTEIRAANKAVREGEKKVAKLLKEITNAAPEKKAGIQTKLADARKVLAEAKAKQISKVEAEVRKVEIRNKYRAEKAQAEAEIASGVRQAKNIVTKESDTVVAARAETAKETEKGIAETKSFVNDIKQVEKEIRTEIVRGVEPIKVGGGQNLKTQMNSRIIARMEALIKEVNGDVKKIDTAYEKADWKKQIANAVEAVTESPNDTYQKFLRNEPFANATPTAVRMALMEHPLFADSIKRTAILNADRRYATAAGQMQQARQMLLRDGYEAAINRLNRIAREVVEKRTGRSIEEEAKKLSDSLGDEFGNFVVASKSGAKKVLDSITCK